MNARLFGLGLVGLLFLIAMSLGNTAPNCVPVPVEVGTESTCDDYVDDDGDGAIDCDDSDCIGALGCCQTNEECPIDQICWDSGDPLNGLGWCVAPPCNSDDECPQVECRQAECQFFEQGPSLGKGSGYAGECVYNALPENTTCDDGNSDSTDDFCGGGKWEGLCLGYATWCEDAGDIAPDSVGCTDYLFNSVEGQCYYRGRSDGAECPGGTCQDSTCVLD